MNPGLRWAIKTRAIALRLRFWDTLTEEAALKQAIKEELAAEPRDWSWWRPMSKKQIAADAARLTALLNQPIQPPPVVRARAAPVKVKVKQSTRSTPAAVSTVSTSTPTPPPAPPLLYVGTSTGARVGPLIDLTSEFERDPRYQHDIATRNWQAQRGPR